MHLLCMRITHPFDSVACQDASVLQERSQTFKNPTEKTLLDAKPKADQAWEHAPIYNSTIQYVTG